MNPLGILYGIVVGAILFLLIVQRNKIFLNQRFQTYRVDFFWLMASMVLIVLLSKLIWQPIACLTIPLFLFGGWYIFYDAFLRKKP